ncbi:hypothetical protein NOCA2570081 [metagenome]|uniref:Uncharacterized protein n=1 Tax=metagenome TaxID=256318 RepID=A0A2P2CB25_9ZZZZ
MVEQPDSRMPVVIDRLYRLRWWISAVLVAALVFLAGDERNGPLRWVILGLFVVLVWAPALFRWSRNARASREAHRDGVNGT